MGSLTGRLLRLGILSLLLVGLLGCAAAAASPTPGASDDLASLRQQVASQGTRIAALETRVSLPQQAAQPTAKPQPTPTVVPAVTGLVVDGNTKGSATAKVTITEYLDYL